MLEYDRDALRAEIRCLSSSLSTAQKTGIAVKRQRLLAKVTKFNQKAALFTAALEMNGLETPLDDPLFCKEEDGNAVEEDIEIRFWEGDEDEQAYLFDPNDDLAVANPESIKICMPSSFGVATLRDVGLLHLAEEEIQLRGGQANDCLDKLRNSLGEKSILYRINKRSSMSNRTDTRSKQDIRRVGLKINRDVRSYHRAIHALTSLDASQSLQHKYKLITHEDLGLSKDITEENRFGQSSHLLPWFWRIEGADSGASNWNNECQF